LLSQGQFFEESKMGHSFAPMMSSVPRITVSFLLTIGFCLSEASWLWSQESEPGSANAVGPAIDYSEIATPPIKKIVFYNSGVAQVIHSAEVDGNVQAELRFSNNDVDDVLKSLTLEDAKGASHSVSYQTAPDAERLAADEFETPLTLAQLLQKYRGDPIQFSIDGEVIRGKILGVERRTEKNESVETLIYLGDRGIRAIPIKNIDDLKFDDHKTSELMERAMIGLTKKRDAVKRGVVIRFKGERKRTIRFSYVIDAPIWRISYRMSMKEDQATLQSWVHLDNVFGNDWQNVEIELRSGRPAAFHADLFAPIGAERVQVGHSVFDIPSNVMISSQWFAFGLRFAGDDSVVDSERMKKSVGGVFGNHGGRGLGGSFGGDKPKSGTGGLEGSDEPSPRNKASVGMGAEGGDEAEEVDISKVALAGFSQDESQGLFTIKLKDLVSLKSGHSASVPVFEREVAARRMVVAKVAVPEKGAFKTHCQAIIELTNNNDLPLLKGPVSIYHQGAFIGDGTIPRTAISKQALVDYGADFQITISISSESPQVKKTGIRFLDNEVELEDTKSSKMTLVAENLNQDLRIAKITLEAIKDWTEIKPKLELIKGSTDLEYDVAANSTVTKEYLFSKRTRERIDLASAAARRTDLENSGLVLPKELIDRIDRFRQLKRAADESQTVVSDLQGLLTATIGEQRRLAEIVKSLNTPDSQKTFADLVVKEEEKIAEIRKNLTEAKQKASTAAEELKQFAEKK
jgi:hypothetical protein